MILDSSFASGNKRGDEDEPSIQLGSSFDPLLAAASEKRSQSGNKAATSFRFVSPLENSKFWLEVLRLGLEGTNPRISITPLWLYGKIRHGSTPGPIGRIVMVALELSSCPCIQKPARVAFDGTGWSTSDKVLPV